MTPLPDALDYFLPAALCGSLLVIGLAGVCIGLVLAHSQNSITRTGRALVVLGGVEVIASGIPVAIGLRRMRASFWIMATSSVAPKADELQTVIDLTAPSLSQGHAILLSATIFPLLATLFGFQKRPSERRKTVAQLLVPAAALVALCYVVVSFLSWQHSVALKEVMAGVAIIAKPAELANHLSPILTGALFNCPLLMLMGAGLSIAGLLAPGCSMDEPDADFSA